MEYISSITTTDGTTYDLKDGRIRSGAGSGALIMTPNKDSTAGGTNAVVFGDKSNASGYASFCGGVAFNTGTSSVTNEASGHASFVWGAGSKALGAGSVCIGLLNTSTGRASIALGESTVASGSKSVALGHGTRASGYVSFCMGAQNYLEDGTMEGSVATGTMSFCFGYISQSNANQSVVFGQRSTANANITYSFGSYNTLKTTRTFAFGEGIITTQRCQMAIGQYNEKKDENANFEAGNDAFVIGNGTSEDSRSNAFRINFNGDVFAKDYGSIGADYAEYFEWADGNPNGEDRIGHFVTLDRDRIKIAGDDDDIIGVISGNGSVIGNSREDHWQGEYETDVFGRIIYEDVEVIEPEAIGEEPVRRVDRVMKKSANYDSSKKYIPRSKRKEWDVVGLLGQIIVIDDGTCVVGGRCSVADGGIATLGSKYRVIKRLDDSHVVVLANFL